MPITFTYYGPDDHDHEHEIEGSLPSRWEVCPTCRGNGAHSLALGALTEEDRARDWDPEDWERYLAGGYDRTCETCDGRRVVAVVDEDSADPVLLALWRQQEDDRLDYEAMCAAERRYGC